MHVRLPRRRIVAAAGSLFGLAAVGRVLDQGQFISGAASSVQGSREDVRLKARPRAGTASTLASGPLGVGGDRDGVIQMPAVVPAGPLPLLVFLHGASGNGAGALRRISPAAGRAGIAVVAPDSRNGTWDVIRGAGFSEDVAYLDRVLAHVFTRLDVDPARVAIGGFSDGASYALSLGLANGDLFPRIVACSPGFIAEAPVHGQPRVFISHGTDDQILPIARCSRVIVPGLRRVGYEVEYREFEGRHELPPTIAAEALDWMTKP
jgi:phospholipase/carboxylesterase